MVGLTANSGDATDCVTLPDIDSPVKMLAKSKKKRIVDSDDEDDQKPSDSPPATKKPKPDVPIASIFASPSKAIPPPSTSQDAGPSKPRQPSPTKSSTAPSKAKQTNGKDAKKPLASIFAKPAPKPVKTSAKAAQEDEDAYNEEKASAKDGDEEGEDELDDEEEEEQEGKAAVKLYVSQYVRTLTSSARQYSPKIMPLYR